VKAISEQTGGLFRLDDFMPLPCAHPNCHTLTYAYRSGGHVVPLLRFVNVQDNLELLANGITFTRARARNLIERYLGSMGCCAGGNCSPGDEPVALDLSKLPGMSAATNGNGRHSSTATADISQVAADFFTRALAEDLSPSDVFRITITSFLDAYNFDVRRVMKCCIHHVLPSGHVVPFCAYNVLYRNGQVQLPALDATLAAKSAHAARAR
jgi:uncharacterized radical SAM superfamily Fe-S cluster-containing enzyme